MAKETVGDMIVRHRKAELADDRTSKARVREILKLPTPRSIQNETWPPR